jgi:hypothetical protein
MDKESQGDGKKKKVAKEEKNTEFSLEVTLHLLRPNELEKLRRYVLAYIAKHAGRPHQHGPP